MPPKPPRIYCCANGCMNSSIKRPELSYFKLPSEEERRMEWLHRISREDLSDKKAKSYVVCEEHFHAHEILRTEHRKNLKKNVLPSLNLPGQVPNKKVVVFKVPLLVESSTQTLETNLGSNTETENNARKRKPVQIATSRAKRIKLDEMDNQSLKQQKEVFHKLCDKFLSNEYSEIVKNKTIQKPKAKTQNIPITTEAYDEMFSILKVKVHNMKSKERICSLIVDAMEVRTRVVYNTREDKFIGFHEVDGAQTSDPATLAVVLMLKGIVFNWQQPVGYVLLSEYRDYESVIKWIDKIIEEIGEIGLDIKALVSNMDTTDMFYLAKLRPTSPEKPYFYIQKRKLLYIFDASHLLMMMRDSLLQNEFHFQGNVANIDHIKQFYKNDCEKSARLAPKLTQKHIDPNDTEKKDLRYATELLSNSVAAAILTYVDFYVIDESGRDTVKLIKLMNDLFDLLSSTKLDVRDGNVFKKAFNADPAQLKLFTDAINLFRSLRLVDGENNSDVTYSAKFIEGFQITITAIIKLLESLRKNGIKNLRTKRLSTNATSKMFAQIRSKCGENFPTVRQFTTAFQEQFLRDLMKPPAGRDCSLQIASLLSTNSSTEYIDDEPDDPNDVSTIEESDNSVKVKSSDYNQLEIPNKNTVVYLSSYLLKRCAEKHRDCQILKSYITPAPEQRLQNFGADIRYQKYRDYCKHTCSSLLVVPYDDFINYVEKMEEEFRKCLNKKSIEKAVAKSIYKVITEINFSPPCPCFPMVYLKKLFIRMRIFHTVQHNNNKWKTMVAKRKYFTVPNL